MIIMFMQPFSKGFVACANLMKLVISYMSCLILGSSLNIFDNNILIDSACKLGLMKEAWNGLAPDAVTWRILDKLCGM